MSCYYGYKKVWDTGEEKMMPQKNYILNRFCDDVGIIFSILRSGITHAMAIKNFL